MNDVPSGEYTTAPRSTQAPMGKIFPNTFQVPYELFEVAERTPLDLAVGCLVWAFAQLGETTPRAEIIAIALRVATNDVQAALEKLGREGLIPDRGAE